MNFKDPLVLLLFPLVLALFILARRRQKNPAVRFPSGELVASLKRTWKMNLAWIPFVLRVFVLSLFIIALAGPRAILDEVTHETQGIDIVLALDGSGSMAAEDFSDNGRRYNRLEVVKKVVGEFIDARPSDRIGLIAFAGLAYTVSPLTTDTQWLKMNLDRVNLNMMEDGTAIGSAISASLSRLKRSHAKSKIIILLTDGINNHGKIDPLSAAKAAQSFGVKIYTIGAGTNGMAPFPVQDIWGRKGYQNVAVEIDESTLKEIAVIANGKYFRATDTESLRKVYQEIDRMEKSKIEETGYREYQHLFGNVLFAALFLLFLTVILESTLFLRLP